MEKEPLQVLFLCTGNSARSQIGEALLRDMAGRIRVWMSLPGVAARLTSARGTHAI